MRREKREATGRANAGGPAGFRARRWTGRGRRARTRRVQAAVREAAVQPLPPGKLLRRGEGGEGSAELEEGRQGTEPGRGHGEEAPRSRRAPPPDAPRCRPPRPRATSRARPRRAESRARRGARPRRASSSRRGVTVTTSPRRVVRGKLRRPVPPYRSGTTTRSQPRVPARAAGETDGFDVPRKPRTRRSRRNASGGRPEANVGTFREKEAFFALRGATACTPREVAESLSPLHRVAPEEAFAVDEFEKLTSVTVFQARRALSVFRRRASRSLDPRLSRTLLVSVPRSCTRHSSPPRSSHFPVLFRGGVLGLLPIMLPNPPMSFLSAGFRIWKLHMRFSSTVIIAPALSNSPQ